MNVELATTDAQIRSCYSVISELRPHLEPNSFVDIIRQLQREGYFLVFLEISDKVVTVAGFRINRGLFCDRFLYVDDLVTLSTERSKGYGKTLLEWLKNRALAEDCAELHLDSASHRKDAHRFYEENRVPISGYHFRVELQERVPWSRFSGVTPVPPARLD